MTDTTIVNSHIDLCEVILEDFLQHRLFGPGTEYRLLRSNVFLSLSDTPVGSIRNKLSHALCLGTRMPCDLR